MAVGESGSPPGSRPVASAAVSDLPHFVIVGAMRSGSTSLYRWLADHPRVFMAAAKEVRYFDQNYERGHQWYRAQFGPAGPGQVRGEATPSYLAHPGALERLAHDVPGVVAIVVLRDPVDRAYSHYWMQRAKGRESRPWEQVVADDLSASDDPRSVLWHSRYSAHLARLGTLLGPQRCLALPFDRLAADPGRLFADVCRFIGAPAHQPPSLGDTVNAHFRVRSQRVRRATMAPWVPAVARNAVGRLNQVETSYPPMSPGLRARLDEHFAADRAAASQAAATWGRTPG